MPNYQQHFETVTIASAAATSSIFQLYGHRIVGIGKPATWTAADLSLEVTVDGEATWVKVIDNAGSLIKITGLSATVAEFYVVPELLDFFTADKCRIVSTNTGSEADVNQDAARTLVIVLAPLPGN